MTALSELLHGALSLPCRGAVCLLVLSTLVGTSGCRRKRLLPRSDAAAVVVVAPHRDAPSRPNVAEQEPNDTPASAQTLALGDGAALTIEAELSATSRKDIDMFKLVVPGEPVAPAEQDVDGGGEPADPRLAARRLALEITPEGSGLTLQLLDEAGKVLTGISAAPGAASGMPNLAVIPGAVYLVQIRPAKPKTRKPAKASMTACHYRLTAQLGDFEIADEREPNDSKETATPVVVVGTVELAGYLGWSRDQDYYQVPLPEVALSLDVELDALEHVGTSLQVVDASGARLGYARGPRGERLALRNVLLNPPAPKAPPSAQHAFIIVRAETGQNRERRYVLRLSLRAPRTNTEVEPNDSPAQATPVKDGSTTGYLPSGDTDFFRYDEEGQRKVTFQVSFPRRIRGKLEAFGPGKLPAGKAESKKQRQLVSLVTMKTPGQSLLLRVSGLRGDGNANEPYALSVSSEPAAQPESPTPPSPATR